MTAVPPDVGELRRLEAAASLPLWFREYGDVVTTADDPRDRFDDEPRAERVVRRAAHREMRDDQAIADADLICGLRNAARWLLGQAEAAQRARAIHVRGIYRTAICASCGDEWPCPTIHALEGDPDATG